MEKHSYSLILLDENNKKFGNRFLLNTEKYLGDYKKTNPNIIDNLIKPSREQLNQYALNLAIHIAIAEAIEKEKNDQKIKDKSDDSLKSSSSEKTTIVIQSEKYTVIENIYKYFTYYFRTYISALFSNSWFG